MCTAFTSHGTEAIVVGEENESAVGIDRAYGVDEYEIVGAKDSGVEVWICSIDNADTEDNHIGMQHAEVASEMLTA